MLNGGKFTNGGTRWVKQRDAYGRHWVEPQPSILTVLLTMCLHVQNVPPLGE